MKTVKVLILFFTLLFTSSAFAQSFKSGSEPNGFRDVEWGTELSTLSGMEYYETSNSYGGYPMEQWDFDLIKTLTEIYLDMYLKIEDKLRIEGAEVKKIEYGFWKGKFCEVTIITKDFENWASIKEAIFEKFGRGEGGRFTLPRVVLGFEEVEVYTWSGKTTEMELLYLESSQIGRLWIGSTLLREQILKEVEQK